MDDLEKRQKIQVLNDVMSGCKLCPNVNHTQIYPGIYRKEFKYFLIGAAPWNLAGPQEAFEVGKAAENLHRFLQLANIARSECYITNAVVHIPTQGDGKPRQPSFQEMSNCSIYLKYQIDLLQPKLVVALGGIALHTLDAIKPTNIFSVSRSVRRLHKWYDRHLMCCTHPSPMAVTFRPEDQQVQDYEMIRINYDSIVNNG